MDQLYDQTKLQPEQAQHLIQYIQTHLSLDHTDQQFLKQLNNLLIRDRNENQAEILHLIANELICPVFISLQAYLDGGAENLNIYSEILSTMCSSGNIKLLLLELSEQLSFYPSNDNPTQILIIIIQSIRIILLRIIEKKNDKLLTVQLSQLLPLISAYLNEEQRFYITTLTNVNTPTARTLHSTTNFQHAVEAANLAINAVQNDIATAIKQNYFKFLVESFNLLQKISDSMLKEAVEDDSLAEPRRELAKFAFVLLFHAATVEQSEEISPLVPALNQVLHDLLKVNEPEPTAFNEIFFSDSKTAQYNSEGRAVFLHEILINKWKPANHTNAQFISLSQPTLLFSIAPLVCSLLNRVNQRQAVKIGLSLLSHAISSLVDSPLLNPPAEIQPKLADLLAYLLHFVERSPLPQQTIIELLQNYLALFPDPLQFHFFNHILLEKQFSTPFLLTISLISLQTLKQLAKENWPQNNAKSGAPCTNISQFCSEKIVNLLQKLMLKLLSAELPVWNSAVPQETLQGNWSDSEAEEETDEMKAQSKESKGNGDWSVALSCSVLVPALNFYAFIFLRDEITDYTGIVGRREQFRAEILEKMQEKLENWKQAEKARLEEAEVKKNAVEIDEGEQQLLEPRLSQLQHSKQQLILLGTRILWLKDIMRV
jgi:hypothetical protein